VAALDFCRSTGAGFRPNALQLHDQAPLFEIVSAVHAQPIGPDDGCGQRLGADAVDGASWSA